jgi:transposase
MATGVTCPGCWERDLRIAALERQVAELEALVRDLAARLGTNATNSSVPPSANPLGAPKPVTKPKSKRRPGGQPGHPPRLKQLLPPERVHEVLQFVPPQCRRCHTPLPAQAGPHDPLPTRHQVIDLPPVVAQVTEYQGHSRTCPCCGEITHATIPSELLAHSVGPRLAASLSYLSGCHGVSKRGVEEIADDLFDAPIALGTVANLEQEVSAALAAPHQQAQAAVQAAPVKHADETSWKLRGRLCWLWGAATASVAVFVVHGKRSLLGLTALLGVTLQGILRSDRWGVYEQVPPHRRQLCWAHLKRDFQKVVDRDGPSAAVGRRGLRLLKKVFAAWHEFQKGRLTRTQLQEHLQPLEVQMNKVLLEGAILADDPKVATFCENLLALEPALWTFARVEGVEPTNNFMERLVRRAVLWRKRSFGCWSQEGCRFVERILTVVQTCRLQGKSVLGFLHDTLRAYRAAQPGPQLVTTG